MVQFWWVRTIGMLVEKLDAKDSSCLGASGFWGMKWYAVGKSDWKNDWTMGPWYVLGGPA